MTTTNVKSRFQPATRKRSKLRMALDGPAGAGKTYTALRMAYTLGARVAVIDTEAGSASKYQGDAPDDVAWNFDVLELESHAPTEYTAAIEEAGRLGYDVIVIDSLSHAWQGKDGALELVNKKGGNSYTAWKDVTPMHTRMIDAILRSPCHVIATMRSKTEYVLETNDKGQQVPRKVGMKPVQRDGMEYEFDLYASLDWSHVLTVTKSRCPSVDSAIVVKPGPAFMQPVVAWLETGEVIKPAKFTPIMATDEQIERIVTKIGEAGSTLEKAKRDIFKRYAANEFNQLTVEQANEVEKRLDVDLARKAKQAQTASATTTAPSATQAGGEPKNGSGQPEPTLPPPAAAPAPVTAPATQPAATPATNGKATLAQLTRLSAERDLFFTTKGYYDSNPEHTDAKNRTWAAILAKRNVTTARDMTPEQVEELIANLAKQTAAMVAERSKVEAAAEVANNTTFQAE